MMQSMYDEVQLDECHRAARVQVEHPPVQAVLHGGPDRHPQRHVAQVLQRRYAETGVCE